MMQWCKESVVRHGRNKIPPVLLLIDAHYTARRRLIRRKFIISLVYVIKGSKAPEGVAKGLRGVFDRRHTSLKSGHPLRDSRTAARSHHDWET